MLTEKLSSSSRKPFHILVHQTNQSPFLQMTVYSLQWCKLSRIACSRVSHRILILPTLSRNNSVSPTSQARRLVLRCLLATSTLTPLFSPMRPWYRRITTSTVLSCRCNRCTCQCPWYHQTQSSSRFWNGIYHPHLSRNTRISSRLVDRHTSWTG